MTRRCVTDHRQYRSRPRSTALVYRGPASAPGCPEAVAALLEAGPWQLDVRFVGPAEDLALGAEALGSAVLYAQPGGGELDAAYRHLRHVRGVIRRFVAQGGSYLGFCLGGYLAGATPGFDLLPGDTDQYIGSRRATVDDDRSTLVTVRWRDADRAVFFQDGPVFVLDEDTPAWVLARYPNGAVAAAVAGFGRGRVGVVGPHPEATADWFTDTALPVHDARDLGQDLIGAVLDPPTAAP